MFDVISPIWSKDIQFQTYASTCIQARQWEAELSPYEATFTIDEMPSPLLYSLGIYYLEKHEKHMERYACACRGQYHGIAGTNYTSIATASLIKLSAIKSFHLDPQPSYHPACYAVLQLQFLSQSIFARARPGKLIVRNKSS